MNHKWIYPIAAVCFCCLAMALVELVLQPGYVIKSAIKLLLFSLFALPCARGLFRAGNLKPALGLGLGIYLFLLAAFFLFRPFLDPEAIRSGLLSKEGLSAENFLWAALYISIVNSLLEELLFRGLAWLELRRHIPQRHAALFSAAAFAAYHVAILRGWFTWWVYALCLAGLFVGGLIFCALDRRGSILPAWIAHAAANLAINTAGMLVLGMIP